MQNFWSAQHVRIFEAAYREALDEVAAALLMLDRAGRVVRMNASADELLRARRWVRYVNGRLHPQRCLKETRALGAALQQVTRGVAFNMTVTEPIGEAQAVVRGAPIAAQTIASQESAVTALLWILPLLPSRTPEKELAHLFMLTAAEERLLGRLLAGDEMREAANQLGVSLNTVRSQLKSIFRKTGRRSQGQLLALATRIATLRSPVPINK